MSVKTSWLALLCGIALALPVAAQEEPVPQVPPPEEQPVAPEPVPVKPEDDPPLHRWGGWTVSLAAWNPTLVGAEEEIAYSYATGVAQPLYLDSAARVRETVRIVYHLPKDRGSIVGQYEGMSQDDSLQLFTPGLFQIAETRAYPLLTGVFDDGTADGVESTAQRTTRDFRLEYQRRAFDSKWARATWGIGYRQLSHQRALAITYHAIVPNLPPAIPPVVGSNSDPLRFAPIPDGVTQNSYFSGHGLGATLDVEFPVHRIVSIVSGLSIGLVRGDTTNAYTSTSSFYALSTDPETPLTFDELYGILSNGTQADIDSVQQRSLFVGLSTKSKSQFAQSFDVYLGVQVLVYRGLRVFATVRDVSYLNVGEYVVPRPGPVTETTTLNTSYEGYAVGISWRF